eukprot:TRINITY_DN3646_c0_g1_i2.p1 TRINITY_DN3646_c0_g1~~TRINITY_DN3646_c0_g1_i2.p1  ORF type:complete len:2996 (+),score=922.89 TRINITY_DN3646_c0_g1_i2:247-9234(+)
MQGVSDTIVKDIWKKYSACIGSQEKALLLHDLLERFLELYSQTDPNLLAFRIPYLEDIANEIAFVFIDQLDSLNRKFQNERSKRPAAFGWKLFEYFTGHTEHNNGLYFVLSLEVLTKIFESLSAPGLAATLVTNLTHLLKTSLKANHYQDSQNAFVPSHYSNNLLSKSVSLPNIHAIFSMPPIPSSLKNVFSGYATSTSNITTNVGKDESMQHDVHSSTLAHLCMHLLSILGNLFKNRAALDELVKYGKLSSLLDVLSAYTSTTNNELLVMQKQLIRTLSSLAETACRELKQIQMLKDENFFPYILGVLRQDGALSTVISLELCQLMVFTVKRSSRISLLLFDEFQLFEGYSVLANNLVSIAKSGTREERVQLISTICHLLFIGNHDISAHSQKQSVTSSFAEPRQIGVQNIESFKILLTAFENTENNSDVKAELLYTIRAIFQLNSKAQASSGRIGLSASSSAPPSPLSNLESFKVFFLQFDSLSMSNKSLILTMMDEVLARRELLPQELKSYCCLLQGKRPSTLILVIKHMIRSIIGDYITRDQLRRAGLIPILTEYLTDPHDLPCEQFLKTDSDELKLSQALQREESHTNQLSQQVTAQQIDRTPKDENSKSILYGILALILDLCRVVLNGNVENQTLFRENNGIKRLQNLLADDALRTPSLQVISILAIADVNLEWSIIPSLITTLLQASGGTASLDSSMLHMRKDILATLCYIFAHNDNSKNAFRTGGGFIWTVSVLAGIDKCMEAQKAELSDDGDSVAEDDVALSLEVFSFLKTLLLTLGVVLTNNSVNQAYFRDDIHFSSLSDTLKSCYFIEGQRAVELCDSLLNMGVKGTWPPSCPKHPSLVRLSPPWEARPSPAVPSSKHSSMTHSKNLVSNCLGCRESLTIENPEIFKLIVQLLGDIAKKKNSESQSTFYISVIKGLSFLADVMPSNQEQLSSIGLMGAIVDHFRELLLRPNSLQPALMGLIHKIAWYNLSLFELRKYLELLRVPNYPLSVLDTLIEMSKRRNIPTYFANYSKSALSYVDIPSLGERIWPPPKGFAMSFWINVLSYPTEAEDKMDICIFSFDSGHKSSTLDCYLTSSGVFRIQVAPGEYFAFGDYQLKACKWHHIVITQSAPRAANKKSTAMLYVNGILQQQGNVNPTKSVPSRLSARFGQPIHAPTPSLFTASWQLGNVFFFEDLASENDVFLLYNIGPNYAGGFDVDSGIFQIYDVINEKDISSHPDLIQLIIDPSSGNFSTLQDKMLFVLSIRNMVIAQAVKIPSFPGNPNVPPITKTLAPSYTRVFTASSSSPLTSSGTANASFPSHCICTRVGIKDLIANAGGVSVIIYLITMAQTKEYQRSSIKLLHTLLQYNSTNVRDMKESSGYQLVAHVMRKKHWVLDEMMLGILFQMVGLSKPNHRGSTYSGGVISNLLAFKNFLLDWKIWSRAQITIQKLLFESLAEAVSSNSMAAFNIKRFREAGVLELTFELFRDNTAMSPDLGTYLISIVKSILADPPSTADIQIILNYLVSTHQTPHIINYMSDSSASSPASLKKIRKNLSTSGTENPRAYLRAKMAAALQLNVPSIRNLVLNMILDILAASSEKFRVIEQFAEVCTMEVLLALMRTDSLPTRILLLKILDMFLRLPTLSYKFQLMKGFNLLGNLLAGASSVSEELFGVLFCILLGQPAYRFQENQIRAYFLGQMSGDVSIAQPAALVPILILVESGDITIELQNAVIKTLHDLFLQNDQVKDMFLENNLVKLLCDLFAPELERKVPYLDDNEDEAEFLEDLGIQDEDEEVPDNENNTEISTATKAALRRERIWKTEETVLAFLKAISLYGCMAASGIALIDDILVTLDLEIGLPPDYVYRLQQKILYDVLLFFHENYFLNNSTLVSTFKQLCVIACDHFCANSTSQPRLIEVDLDSSRGPPTDSKWKTCPCLPDELEFIRLLFEVLSQSRNRISAATQSNYLPFFPALYAIQNQFGRLILHLISPIKNPGGSNPFLQWTLSQLSSNTPILADFTSSEEFINRLIVYTFPLLVIEGPAKEEAWKIWNAVFRSKKSFLKNLFVNFANKSLSSSASSPRDYSIDDLLRDQDISSLAFQTQVLQEVKKMEEKESLAEKEYLQERQSSREKKTYMNGKGTESVRASNHLINNTLIQLQQQQAKVHMDQLKQSVERDKTSRKQWKNLCKSVAHERGVWPAVVHGRWKLDSTEGTDRTRPRLKRPTARLPFLTTAPIELSPQSNAPPEKLITPDMLAKEAKQRIEILSAEYDEDFPAEFYQQNIKPGERIISYFKCSRITPFHKREGEIIIAESHCYFIDDFHNHLHKVRVSGKESPSSCSSPKNLTFHYEDMREIHKRRYLLKNNALELFLTNGKTYLLAFENEQERDASYDAILSSDLPNRVDYEYEVSGGILKMSVTARWKKGLISNFEYLMHLNTLAGRSFNDLTQYPVFPFVLADYSSQELDLTNPATFRDLSKAMGAQDPKRLVKFEERYQQLMEMGEAPFHYGSHYSNIGSVLHFLVRLEPFSQYFIEFQSGKFDVADRAFHSLGLSWMLSSSLSSSDVKELIPEFFFLPEFLINMNHFDMGVKQNGERVADLVLPPWAKGSARLFIKKHREALECKYVSENLHHWIDLMFGYQQRGDEAYTAKNCFHPLTYEGAVDIDSIEDQVTKEATIAQISSYGQTPKQLFKKPHPERDSLGSSPETICSSPEKLTPYPMWSCSTAVGFLTMINDTPIALSFNKLLISSKGDQFVSWGHWDQSLRICALDTGKLLTVIETKHNDDTICGDVQRNGNVLVTGGTAGVVKIWKRSRNVRTRTEHLHLHSVLYGHSAAITCVCLSLEWSIIVSGSKDSTCIVWDLNRLSYVRSLFDHEGTVTCAAISPNTGNIVTVATTKKGSTIRLWSVNGDLLASNPLPDKVQCVKFTKGTEGVVRNLVIAGQENGHIKLFDAWDLTLLQTLEGHRSAVNALGFTQDLTQLISGDDNGLLLCWSTRKPRDAYSNII